VAYALNQDTVGRATAAFSGSASARIEPERAHDSLISDIGLLPRHRVVGGADE
jgi:hypothetical protein